MRSRHIMTKIDDDDECGAPRGDDYGTIRQLIQDSGWPSNVCAHIAYRYNKLTYIHIAHARVFATLRYSFTMYYIQP